MGGARLCANRHYETEKTWMLDVVKCRNISVPFPCSYKMVKGHFFSREYETLSGERNTQYVKTLSNIKGIQL